MVGAAALVVAHRLSRVYPPMGPLFLISLYGARAARIDRIARRERSRRLRGTGHKHARRAYMEILLYAFRESASPGYLPALCVLFGGLSSCRTQLQPNRTLTTYKSSVCPLLAGVAMSPDRSRRRWSPVEAAARRERPPAPTGGRGSPQTKLRPGGGAGHKLRGSAPARLSCRRWADRRAQVAKSLGGSWGCTGRPYWRARCVWSAPSASRSSGRSSAS